MPSDLDRYEESHQIKKLVLGVALKPITLDTSTGAGNAAQMLNV